MMITQSDPVLPLPPCFYCTASSSRVKVLTLNIVTNEQQWHQRRMATTQNILHVINGNTNICDFRTWINFEIGLVGLSNVVMRASQERIARCNFAWRFKRGFDGVQLYSVCSERFLIVLDITWIIFHELLNKLIT